MRLGLHARRLALLALGAAAWSCARQGAPPGGPEDRRPPLVVSVRPDTFAVVEPGLDKLEVRFNERISEQTAGGALSSAVEVSPEVPDLRVEHDRRGLDIHIPGGLRPDLVYRVRVSPTIRDMFGNSMAVPFEWVFSTGGEFTDNAVVGQVWDRATGDFLEGVRIVLAPPEPSLDSLLYVSQSGEEGLFALRSVPSGSFDVLAFRDQNNDREPGGSEARGREGIEALGATDTVFLSLSLLVPDTTAAVLVRAEALDSVAVRLTFDDFVDPTVPLDGSRVELSPLPADSFGVLPPQPEGPLPTSARLFHAGEWAVYEDSIGAVRDSLALLAGDSLGVLEGRDPEGEGEGAAAALDSLAGDLMPGDSLESGELRGQGPAGPDALRDRGRRRGRSPSEPRVLPDGTPIPEPLIVVLFDGPLPPGVEVEVSVAGVTNLNGLEDGGGSATVAWTPPPPPDTLPADSLPLDSLPPDTAGLVPDTGGLNLDTVRLVPDTVGLVRGVTRGLPDVGAGSSSQVRPRRRRDP